jgi:hypothetical protein
VLVLRSRPADWRSPIRRRAAELALARAHPQLAPLLRSCDRRYNAAAAALEALAEAGGAPAVRQVTVAPGARLVGRFSTDVRRIADSVRLGAEAMSAALGAAPPALRLAEPPPRRRRARVPQMLRRPAYGLPSTRD